MDNTAALTNNAVKDYETSGHIDEYDDEELSEELIADLKIALEQAKRREGISLDEMKERLSKRYGIKF